MDSLPIEILHKIFRLVPPTTFYTILPLISRTIRDATDGAIPGCPGRTVAIECKIIVRPNLEQNFDRSRDSMRVKKAFETVVAKDGSDVGTFAAIDVSLSLSEIAQNATEHGMEALVDRKAVQLSSVIERLHKSNRSVDVTFGEVDVHITVGRWDSEMVSTIRLTAIELVAAFVRRNRVSRFTCSGVATAAEFYKALGGNAMDSVILLRALNLTDWFGRPPSKSNTANAMSQALIMCPNVRTLETGLNKVDNELVNKLTELVPASIRHKITTLQDPSGVCCLFKSMDNCACPDVAQWARVLPNVRRLGQLKIPVLPGAMKTFMPRSGASTSPLFSTMQFPHLEAVHLSISVTDARFWKRNLIGTPENSFTAHIMGEGLAQWAPRLEEFVFTFSLYVQGPAATLGQRQDQKSASDMIIDFVSKFGANFAGRTPMFVIGQIREHIFYECENVIRTRGEVTSRAQMNETKELVAGLEKMALEKAIKLRWLRGS